MIEYKQLKHRVGTRRYSMLESPKFTRAANMQLPFGGVLHFHTDSPDVLGPSADDPFLRGITKPIFIDHVTDLTAFAGNPRLLSVPVDPLKRQHRKANRTLRPLAKLDIALRDKKSILVENYCLVERQYRYQPGIRSGYNRWANTWSTIVDTMGKLAPELTGRQQFIKLEIPTRLPAMAQMRYLENAGRGFPPEQLRKNNDPTLFTLVDLFTWIGPHRDKSILSRLPDEALASINICWVDSGYWTFFNLGDLNDWRNVTKKELDSVDKSADLSREEKEALKKAMKRQGDVDPKTLQRSFMIFLIKLFKLRSAAADDRVADAVLDDEEGDSETIETNDAVRTETPDDAVDAEADIDVPLDEAEMDAEIDRNTQLLDEFDRMTDEMELSAGEVEEQLAELVGKELAPEDHIVALADEYAKKGVISADAYRRTVKNAAKYKTIPNPVPGGEGTLEDLATISLEDLKVPDDPFVAPQDLKGVTDKSMLKATKDYVDQTYLEKMHHANIARMVLGAQKGDVSVQGYKIDKHEDHFGAYEIHTVKLAPVVGMPSSISFKVAAIEPDGSYRSNNVRYRMRSQRTD